MDSVNLYVLYQGQNLDKFGDYKKALSNMYQKGKDKEEEIKTLLFLVEILMENGVGIENLDNFFFGFSIPHIGKEFDLLKIYENGPVINIELKSQPVGEEKIEKQLRQNRYYLEHLSDEIYTFTFVKNESEAIWYFYDGESLKESCIEDMIRLLNLRGVPVQTGIEKLFKERKYLISPINTPNAFIQGKYYLTNQQEQIKNTMVKQIQEGQPAIWGIKGSAGTGKTLLLYDIAKTLAEKMSVCVIHSGILSRGHILLSNELNRVLGNNITIMEVVQCKKAVILENGYECILVDEAQRLYQPDFDYLIEIFKEKNINCIFSYDYNQVLSHAEKERNIPGQLAMIENFKEQKLSERIRTNAEVNSFIKNVIDLKNCPKSYVDYSNIEVLYAADYNVAKKIVNYYTEGKKYKFITYTPSRYVDSEIDTFSGYTNTHHVIGQEFDNVIISMDNNFRYDKEGRLQGKVHPNPDYIFYQLWFQGVSRAREKLCILIIGNEKLFNSILDIKIRNGINNQ